MDDASASTSRPPEGSEGREFDDCIFSLDGSHQFVANAISLQLTPD